MMNWFKYNYNNIPVYITENGISDRNGSLYDYDRIHFYRLYISEVLKGKREVKSHFCFAFVTC